MNSLFFATAGGLAAIWLTVHLFVGGKEIVRPLINTFALDSTVRHTQYLCWHFTSVAIACMSAFFIWAAVSGDKIIAIAGIALALGFFLVGVGLVMSMKEDHKKLPQGWLFLPVALLGILGLVA